MFLFKKIKNGDTFCFLVLLSIFAVVFTLIYMSLTRNIPAQYPDIILELNAYISGNKSIEMILIYTLSFLGIFACTLFYFFIKSKHIEEETTHKNNFPLAILLSIGLSLIIQTYCIKYNSNSTYFIILLYATVCFFRKKEQILDYLGLFFINLYFIYALNSIILLTSANSFLTVNLALLVSFAISTSFVFINNDKVISKIILIEQIILPALFLPYLYKSYLYDGEIINLISSPKVNVLISLIMLTLFSEAVFLTKKHWRTEAFEFNKILSLGAIISIWGFNIFNANINIAPIDIRHPYENIICFNQIFQLGQVPFKEFIPVSGMYSCLHGAILHFFGNDYITNYYMSENILFLLFAILTVILLRNQLSKRNILLLSLIYFIYSAVHSNRILLILPVLLILSSPKIIENKNLWLKAYILTSLVHILYYPLYGVAVCFAYLPMGMLQFITYLKSEEIKADIKTLRFWLNWFWCFVLLMISTPMVWETYKHIRVMSKQTIYADGLDRFCQFIPDKFFPFLSGYPLSKSILMTILTFVLIALFIWVTYSFALSLLNKRKGKVIENSNLKNFCLVVSLPICMLLTLTYGMVRLDNDSVFVRNIGSIFACSVMLIIYSYRFFKAENKKHIAKLFCFLVIMSALAFKWGIFIDENKIQKYKELTSEEYVFVQNNPEFKSGTGFIPFSTWANFSDSLPTVRDGISGYFAKQLFYTYYIFDLKGYSILEAYSVKSYPAVKETTDILKKNNIIVGSNHTMDEFYTFESQYCNFNPFTNYYLYHWLLTSGYYIWDYDEKVFLYNDKNYTKNEVLDINKDIHFAPTSAFLGLYPNSLGLSMKSLNNIFQKPEIKFELESTPTVQTIKFNDEIKGDSADFIFIEFDDVLNNYNYYIQDSICFEKIEKENYLAKWFGLKRYNEGYRIKVQWEDNEIIASFGEGKLLIPLGAGDKWLLNNHKEITVSAFLYDDQIDCPQIKNIQFLKLREIE